MNPQTAPGLGQFHPGDSWLHRFDARGKLLLLPLLIMVTFRVAGFSLLLPALLGIVLAEISGFGIAALLRGLRPLRWLLVTTVLLHLFMTPGRTLGPFSWLSYDGLLLGLQNASQLLLAMLFACLLSLTTSPDELASALVSLLQPLRRVGVPVARLAALLSLTLHFVPLLRDEGLAAWRRSGAQLSALKRGPLLERGRVAAGLIEPLMLRLADRADQMARRMAAGEVLAEIDILPAMKTTLRLQVLCGCLLLFFWGWL